MKKKLLLSTALAALLMSFAPMQAAAENHYWEYTYMDDTFTVDAENFHYSTGFGRMCLETEVECKANYMVSGICRYPDSEFLTLIMTPINSWSSCRSIAHGVRAIPEWENPQLGDMIHFTGISTVGVPPLMGLYDMDGVPQFEYLGNGIDIYGEEFKKVVRHELIDYWYCDFCAPSYFDYILPGDLTEDDQVTIVDAIALNKSLMAGMPLRDCAKIAADVDQNGVIDETDSLNILKHIVGLVPDLSALAD